MEPLLNSANSSKSLSSKPHCYVLECAGNAYLADNDLKQAGSVDVKISTILDQIDIGTIALPEFQRGYVWNRDQVRGLMDSLYRKHPVGSLLVWMTKTESASPRGDGPLPPGSVKLLLDGQQRITSLYGIIRGKSPAFFEGNSQAFTGLYFNLDTETFEFYAPLRMRDNPRWINVTELMQKGVGDFIARLFAVPELQPKMGEYITRLGCVDILA
jgi:hypothetical protein